MKKKITVTTATIVRTATINTLLYYLGFPYENVFGVITDDLLHVLSP